MKDQDISQQDRSNELDRVRQRVEDLERAVQAADRERGIAQPATLRPHEGEQRYRTLADSSPDVIYILDRDGRLKYGNRVAAAYMRMSQEELRGKSQQDLFPPDMVNLHLERIRHVFESGQMHEAEEVYRFGPEELWLNVRLVPLRDEQGKVTSLMGICRNVTGRKRAEEALRRAEQQDREELERRVEERTAELRRVLQASDHERQMIAYEIHDGLAQQLAGALMQFQVFEDTKEANPARGLQAYQTGVALLQQGYAEARRLIRGMRPPVLEESGIVATIAQLAQDPAFESGPKVVFCHRVSFTRLTSILENVIYRIVQEGLANARRHSRSERIAIRLFQRGPRLRIAIRDWGVGFNPQTVPADRFGLEGIRQRTTLLGGKCRIRSCPGKGTLVSVFLPVIFSPGSQGTSP